MNIPGYWMHEQTGILAPVVRRYLTEEAMSPQDIATMRAYLRQWINGDGWQGPAVEQLRRRVDELTSREAIDRWLDDALEEGIDPL